MKNMKKLLAIVVCIAMLMPSLAFAAVVSPSKQIGNATVVASNLTYTGSAQSTKLKVTTKSASGKTITLVEGKDYVIASGGTATNANTYKVTIKGIGKYAGTQTVSYKVSPKTVPVGTGSKVTYTGATRTATIKVTDGNKVLKAGVDYTITGTLKRVAAGTYKVLITGKGNYTGKRYVQYTIAPKAVTTAAGSKATYNGAAQTATIKVTDGKKVLQAGVDYKIEGSLKATKAGTYKVTVVGMGNYSGKKVVEYTIAPKAVSTVAGSSRTYTGKAQTAAIKVSDGKTVLKAGVDYTIEGSLKATNAGTYKVTVTGKGNYRGSKVVTYTIKKANQSAIKITSNAAKKRIAVTGVKGNAKVTYATSNSRVTVKNGVVTVGKNVKKGTQVKVTVTVGATANYNAYKKTFTYVVR